MQLASRNNNCKPVIDNDKWLTSEEVSRLTGLAVATLAKYRTQRIGIPFYRLGRAIRYKYGDVESWIHGCKIETDA